MGSMNLNSVQSLLMPWRGSKSFIDTATQIAEQLGWYPSDIVENSKSNSIATGHLFVEHGLDNPAVISFIDNTKTSSLLELKSQIDILGLSYNNLIDYHLTIDSDKITAFHNRMSLDNNILYTQRIDSFHNSLRSDYFFNHVNSKPTKTNLRSLDEELINNISRWKRFIYSELNGLISNEELSNFFNAIIFVRALEDSIKNDNTKVLMKALWSDKENFSAILESVLQELKIDSYPSQVINKDLLGNINKLEKSDLNNVFASFYKSSEVPYNYDFSIISKHALSRIYEKYVSILNVKESIQLNIFNNTPNPFEEINKSSGSYYTPQFIARFFTRYVDRIKPELLSTGNVKTLEPAVGSGIFLRTLLEDVNNDSFKTAFNQLTGIDKNATACDASKLSLTLLHLVKTNSLPKNINVINQDALDYFAKNKEKFDVVLSNPPFINYGALSDEDRFKVKSFLGEYSHNKYDLYLSFIKIAIEHLADDGIGLFVLPSTFLTTDSAKLIRKYLIDKCNILCIADLSAVDYKIFEDAGVYPILFIFQRRSRKVIHTPKATIALIRDYIGKALTDILSGDTADNLSYNIFHVSQDYFKNEKWHLLAPAEANLKMRLSHYNKLSDFVDIRTGFAAGAMDAFTIDKLSIPNGEEDIYAPYLSDREMDSYSIIEDTKEYLFYPYIDNVKIDEDKLQERFPQTYKRLKKYYDKLSRRSEVLKDNINWWEPNRPRQPNFMLVPKIVTPHLVFTPKFSYDIAGKFAVSRTPFITLNKKSEFASMENDFMFYLLGMLNSSVCTWHLLNHAARYQNGFIMLEPSSLKGVPIVNPLHISRPVFLKFISLVKERYLCKDDSCFDKIINLEKQITELSNSFFGLNDDDFNVISGCYGDHC